jgi:hypothetical protein
MVSDLSQACSDGDLNKVNQLLLQASPLDIEEKGASPFSIFFLPNISLIVLSIPPNLRFISFFLPS